MSSNRTKEPTKNSVSFFVFRNFDHFTSQQKAMNSYLFVLSTIFMMLLMPGTVHPNDTFLVMANIKTNLIRRAFPGSSVDDAATALIPFARILPITKQKNS